MPMGGDPGAVQAGAAELGDLAGRYTASGEAVRAAGSGMAASWLGPAASLAQQSIGRIGQTTAIPAHALQQARPALEAYAQALREAQEMYARGERMAADGTAAQLAGSGAPASPQRDQALARAAGQTQAGEVLQAQAVAKEQQANQAAATTIQGLTGELAGMEVQVPDPGAAATYILAGPPGAAPFSPQLDPGEFTDGSLPPPPPPQRPASPDHGGWSGADIGHTLLDVAGLIPVIGAPADAANAIWYAADGDYLNAGLSAAAVVPGLGWGATGAKWGIKGAKALDKGLDAARTVESAAGTLPTDARAGENALPAGKGPSTGEPVDLGTGHVFLPQTDVELPGALPLVLRRTYHSRWRSGRFFGPTWASTLDQHLLVGDDTVFLAGEDAFTLRFPVPSAGPVPAVETRRRRLARTTGGWTVADLDTGTTRHFDEDPDGAAGTVWLTAITDRAGHRIDVVRDPDGVPHEVRHSGGYRVRVRAARDRVVGFDLESGGPQGRPRAFARYGYVAGNLTAVVNSSDLPLRMGYDDEGRMTGWEDRNGTWFRHEYDDLDRVVRQTGSGDALSAAYAYDDDAGVVSRTDSLGRTSHAVHDDRGRVVREIDPAGKVRATTWSAADELGSVVDELGRGTAYEHDEDGALVAVVRPDGARIEITRDALGLPALVVDADGSRWEHEHDGRGLRVTTTDPAGARTAWTYDDAGHLTSVTDALGGVSTVTTDRAGLTLAVRDPGGHTTTWERDGFGRVSAEVDAEGGRTEYGWTLEGRLATRTAADGGVERYRYDPEGNLTSRTDAAGAVTRFEHGVFDRVTTRIDGDGSRTGFSWDSELRLVRVTDPLGLTWDYEHDGLGRVVAETDFDGRRRTWELDAAGQVIAQENAGGERVELVRDALGQVVERRVDGAVHGFEVDPLGRLLRASTPDTDLVLERDALGRVLSEAVDGRAVSSEYDALGRRVGRTTPAGVESAWSYDAASRVTSLLAGEPVGFDHDAVGRETRRSVGSVVLEQRWAAGRLARQHAAGAVDRTYSYRADGALESVATAAGREEFDLDAAGRVTAVRGTDWTERYVYDRAGNTVDAVWAGADEAGGPRQLSGTRVHRAGGVTYEHDAAGRLVRRTRRRLSHRPDTWHYSWDALDRLVGVTTPDGARWRYRYDALGRRVAKERLDGEGAVAETVAFAWDDATLIERVVVTDGRTETTTWDHDESGLRPVSQRERVRTADQVAVDERFYAIVTDIVGAPTELLRPDGSVAGSARRTLWGHTTWTGEASSPLLFPGQHLDPETGLAENLHRHYDPDTARYASLDPLGLEPAPNPATYVHNPHTWADPLGLNPCGPQPPSGGGRSANRMQADPTAVGDHTVVRRNPDTGQVTHYQTFYKEDRAPSGWQPGPRFRGEGGEHGGIKPPIYYPNGSRSAIPAPPDTKPMGYP